MPDLRVVVEQTADGAQVKLKGRNNAATSVDFAKAFGTTDVNFLEGRFFLQVTGRALSEQPQRRAVGNAIFDPDIKLS